MELLDRYRQGRPEPFELVEHTPRPELVSPVDIIRRDTLGRTYVAVPAGQSPHSRVVLIDEERAALYVPPPPPPAGTPEYGPGGFTPRNVKLGFTFESGGTR
jgi:hypothetical protein